MPITTEVVWFESRLWRGVLDATLCDKICQWLATDRWFSLGTPVSSTNKTDRHDIAEILLNTMTPSLTYPLFSDKHGDPLPWRIIVSSIGCHHCNRHSGSRNTYTKKKQSEKIREVCIAEQYVQILINFRDYRMGNKKWTIQRNRQHWYTRHKTKTKKAKAQHNYVLDISIWKQTQITHIRHEPSYKQQMWGVKTYRTSFFQKETGNI